MRKQASKHARRPRKERENLREEMVNDVVVDDVVKEVAADPAEITVNGGEGALNKGPALGLEVRDVGVGMVEIGDGNQPVVNPHVGLDVHEENHLPADVGRGKVEDVSHDGEAEIGDGNEDGLAGTEDGRGGLEVADAKEADVLLLLAVGAGRDVEEEVRLPASELVEEELDDLNDGDVLKELAVEVQVNEAALLAILGGVGNEGHVLLHVAGEAVVAVVRVLPAEVGDHQGGVKDPAHHIVELGVQREGAVAALVGENPHAGEDEALDVSVDSPGDPAEDRVLDLGDVSEGSPAKGEGHGHITDDIAHGSQHGGLEAVSGNGVPDGLNVGIHRALRRSDSLAVGDDGMAIGLSTSRLERRGGGGRHGGRRK